MADGVVSPSPSSCSFSSTTPALAPALAADAAEARAEAKVLFGQPMCLRLPVSGWELLFDQSRCKGAKAWSGR